jgi:hypothetical protein
MATNINNLNILTFIKDIYQSLKHIDNCFNSYKENIDSRLSKIEDNQNTILDKLNILEQILYKINSNTQQQVALDKNIENELMEKMNNLNKNTTIDKLSLKPGELTFANIIENNYSIHDITDTLNTHTNTSYTNTHINQPELLLSFSSTIYETHNIPSPIDANTNTITNKINKKENLENLENLLF